jgi:hypothetical protein
MSPSVRFVITAILGFTVGALVWVSRSIDAQISAIQALTNSCVKAGVAPSNGGQCALFAGSGTVPPLEPTMTVHVTQEMTPAQARTWLRLKEPIAMPFPDETTLEDMLKYIKAATFKDKQPPIPIYVDPIGLQVAEKTMQSTVSLDLDGISLETSLQLMLKQLGLTYSVNKEGLLVIDSSSCDDTVHEPATLMLDHLVQLRSEVAALRWEVAVMRTGSLPIRSGGTCIMGGMGGGIIASPVSKGFNGSGLK